MNILKIKKLHMWTGVLVSIFALILATTGVVLNHRDQLKVSGKPDAPMIQNKLKMMHGFKIEELPVTPSKAIEAALSEIGDKDYINKFELKKMEGGLIYKLETKSKNEIYVDPVTGSVYKTSKGSFNILRLSKMLHTGEGLINNVWFYDAIGIVICLLVLTGAFMSIRRQKLNH